MKDSSLQKLTWDSEFFNKNIGTFTNIKLVSTEELSQFDLITNKVSATAYHSIDILSQMGFAFVEGELEFEKKLELSSIHPITIEHNIAQDNEIDKLVSIAQTSFIASRFRAPWFSQQQKSAFYGLWIKKAVLGEFDDVCLVLKHNNEIQGFISLKKENTQLKIGLIAVAKSFQGKGVAKHLLKLAEQYALKHQCTKILVATQTSNLPATNLYMQNGYSLIKSNYWLYKTNTNFIEGHS